MGKNQVIETAIDINSTPGNVWRVFTDPVVTRQMGGEYDSGWQTGSPIRWKGADGTFFTNGTILEIEPARLLRHDLSDPKDTGRILSVITYTIEEINGMTNLSAKEELNFEMTEKKLEQSKEGWDIALRTVKDLAEKLV